ncbi:hypothetical protein Patl1_23702 [Pistacia atlantica]|uniref:Uncharacterized protein n=1 Tax=Pistacia atlantica TaxID=434234 RepID=A0ACC1A235_9ROSI|nr:hypothetical protein Patl1_23702 [Pistacia atlantica]
MVPLKCACPNANQSANGVTSLLTYIVGSGETYGRIANYFGVDRQSIQEANEIVSENYIRTFTTLLIPLKSESCATSPEKFFCHCLNDFIELLKDNQLLEILDPRVATEAREEDIQSIAELAVRCLRLNGKKRPTMKGVVTELEGLIRSQSSLEIDQEPQQMRDEMLYMETSEETQQGSIEDSSEFSLQLESE